MCIRDRDKLHSESVRLTNFHVSPFCTPTRAALMTGRYPARTGAYRTSSGRTMMHPDEKTIANVFADNGYATGMVGKWHLGDNAPHRPQDRGFQDVTWHRCGGVGQASDYWGNDYFDDVYEKDGKFEKFEGYCTDVWFNEAIDFVENNKEKPFLLYLATNAPHGPFLVGKEWSGPYKDKVNWKKGPEFYGMITNFDHNIGILRDKLKNLGISENTILVFMTDNGTSKGGIFDGLDSEPLNGYNAGMRGKKSSVYEGGHRVPFFIHWPEGNLVGGKDINALTAHIDVLPTISELCGISVPDTYQPDGISFNPLLQNLDKGKKREHLVVQFQGGANFKGAPKEWEHTCIVKDDWRLINGKELYNIKNDPNQSHDIAETNPRKVEELRAVYPSFWESVSPRMTPVSIDLGNPDENPTTLCSQDWYLPKRNPPWNFRQISKLPKVTGPWKVDVKDAGKYRFTLRQFPKEANKPIKAVKAKIVISGLQEETAIEENSTGVVFELDLPKGKTELLTYLTTENGEVGGAYFTDVEALGQ